MACRDVFGKTRGRTPLDLACVENSVRSESVNDRFCGAPVADVGLWRKDILFDTRKLWRKSHTPHKIFKALFGAEGIIDGINLQVDQISRVLLISLF